jgi:Asp-tRNA(Asn)/Glu-tRNA(Gln) amidotransferase A subunit family amidase
MLDEIPFTPLFNATGAPAASVPLSKTEDGLPIGIQIGAAFGREKTLLRLARELEVVSPWHSRI